MKIEGWKTHKIELLIINEDIKISHVLEVFPSGNTYEGIFEYKRVKDEWVYNKHGIVKSF